MTTLEKELEVDLLDICEKCKSIGYSPNYFKRMLVCSNASYVKGPVGTVRHLMLGAAHPQSGFARLTKANRIEWTVEWLITHNPKYERLFHNSDWVLKNANARIRSVQNSTPGQIDPTADRQHKPICLQNTLPRLRRSRPHQIF